MLINVVNMLPPLVVVVSWLMSICQLRRQNDLLPQRDNRSLIALHWSLCKWGEQRGRVSGVKWSEVWVDDDIVTAVTFNEIENRTCNRNVQRFAYVCNASESCVELAGAGGRKGVLHGSGQVICLFFEQSPPQMEGQAASLRGSLGRKGFLDLITDSLTGPPMQFTKMPACMCVCV